MRRQHALPLLLATVAGGLLLTGCGGSSDSDSGSSGASAAPLSSPLSSDTGGSSTGSSDASTATGTSGSSASGSNASGSDSSGSSSDSSSGSASGSGKSGASGGGRCHTSGLSFAVAPGSGAQSVGSQGAVVIKMTNTSSSACTMNGYPGLDLLAGGETWSLGRQAATPRTVTVQPGGSTSFTITYLPFEKGDGQEFDVKTIVITPPNETTSAKLAWDFQPVLRQDGATHPGTYVGPVGGK
ncbi:DUF4232 domain-containing protein [Streptomyces sp. 8L]|uniref:DUF4232 domain-containing protein n=1 Tax=Streptomyces sp. 8L TaxID=2877242 RepID=UPI001CD3AD83|nr:DUF4232 domain-containing protein [Streptomyces sp. 8L]MCA1220970.1 DUF4232 domain-containing protein [Streptomyces sp. 8L]